MSRTSQSPEGEEHPPEQRFLFADQRPETGASEAKEPASSRKLQVSNGYLLEFERLSQLLSALVRIGPKGRITRADIMDETGLPDRSIAALVSMATAMGILKHSKRTLRKVIQEEVHFVVGAYLEQKLKTLDILEVGDGQALIPRRYRNIDHLIFAAMLYDFIESHGGRTLEIMELTRLPGSPAALFQLDADSVRALAETLHNEGLVRYETTHNLDQIRLLPGYGPEELLRAYFDGRKPQRQGEIGGARG